MGKKEKTPKYVIVGASLYKRVPRKKATKLTMDSLEIMNAPQAATVDSIMEAAVMDTTRIDRNDRKYSFPPFNGMGDVSPLSAEDIIIPVPPRKPDTSNEPEQESNDKDNPTQTNMC